MSTNKSRDLLEIINSDDSQLKIEMLDSLDKNVLDESSKKLICSLINDPDKGVKNSLLMFITSDPDENLSRYIVSYISSGDISVRNLAGEILVKSGEASLNPLLEKLKGANEDDRKFVIDVLGLMGDYRSCRDVFEQLKIEKSENVILACIETLGNIRCKEVVGYLVKLYGKNDLFNPTIIEALGKISTPESLKFLEPKINSEDPLVKFSVIESLGEIGSEETFFFLLTKLRELNEPFVSPLIDSIYMLKNKFNLDIPYDEKIKNAILKTIYEAETKYQITAAQLSTIFDDKETFTAWLHVYGLDYDLDEVLKEKFFNNLGLVYSNVSDIIHSNPANLKALLSFLKESLLSGEAELKEIPPLEVRHLIDSILRCLDNPDEEIRVSSVELLFGIDPGTAVLFLDNLVDDCSIWVKLKVLDYLEEIFSPEANEALKKLSGDAEEMIKERAAAVLSQRIVV